MVTSKWSIKMERETRIELATNSLEGCDSTIELLPRLYLFYTAVVDFHTRHPYPTAGYGDSRRSASATFKVWHTLNDFLFPCAKT
jgi:hypothetical protein